MMDKLDRLSVSSCTVRRVDWSFAERIIVFRYKMNKKKNKILMQIENFIYLIKARYHKTEVKKDKEVKLDIKKFTISAR